MLPLPQVVIPQQCLLNPSPVAAVVGGNVLTSQRVTDVVLKAFGAAAASQVRGAAALFNACLLKQHHRWGSSSSIAQVGAQPLSRLCSRSFSLMKSRVTG